jgi:MerR family transcriptional regulator, light-induced transcriptional regulator
MSGGYSIRVVASETGIPADTLRVWERRYGFPKPSRRPGGGRLYDESDVTRLRLIARARDAGFRPGDVITLPDEAIAQLLRSAPAARTAAGSAARTPEPPIEDLVRGIRADEVGRVRATLRSLAIQHGPKGFVTRIANPLAIRIGAAWEEGTLEVRQEHVASELVSTQLRMLLGALEDGETSPTVVLATLPGEHHVLGLEMVAVYLAAERATPRLVGANTPPDQIARAARAMNADVVGISITSDSDDARRNLALLRDALADPSRPPVRIWLGGPAAEAAAARDPVLEKRTTWAEIDRAIAAFR